MKDKKFNYIDLYAGIGGFKYALDSIGGKCIFTAEKNKSAIETYKFNHKDIKHPINFDMDTFANMSLEEITIMPEFVNKKVNVIAAGFPCQTFSVAGNRRGFDENDTRGTQFFNVLRLVKALKPEFVVLENVKNLKNHDNGKTFDTIINSLKNDAGYIIEMQDILSPLQIGVPQNRERIFIIAKRKDINFELSKPKIESLDSIHKNSFKSGKKIIKSSKNPEGLMIKEEEIKVINVWSEFVNLWFENRNPKEASIPALWLEEMLNGDNDFKSDMPDWKIKMIKNMQVFYNNHKRWIDDWYQKNNEFLNKRIYRKLEWNAGTKYKPNRTYVVIRQSGVRFKRPNFFPSLVASVDIPVVYDQVEKRWRNISLSEMIKLQSLPNQFEKPDNISYHDMYKQLGNSVNVELVKRVVETFKDFFS